MHLRTATLIFLTLALPACDGVFDRSERRTAPVRLVVGKADTVLVNSRAPVQLPVRLLDANGNELQVSGVRYERLSGDSVTISGLGRVTCTRAGDAELRVSVGTLTTRAHVICRPVKGFRFIYDDTPPLIAGGPPRHLQLPAIGLDGNPVTTLAGTVTVGDTNVAALHELIVYPRGPGSTSVDVDIGDCVFSKGVEVHEPVSSPGELRRREQLFAVYPLRLVDGEIRSWRLPRGEYRVGLVPERGNNAELVLKTTAMNCVQWLGSGQEYHCIALAGASVNVHNPRSAGSGGELAGDFFVQRWDVPFSTPDGRPRNGSHAQIPEKRFCRDVR
jgi:hypothetical protein